MNEYKKLLVLKSALENARVEVPDSLICPLEGWLNKRLDELEKKE